MEVLSPASASTSRPFPHRAAWILLLVLSPLAYLTSFYVAKKLPSRNTPITINREQAIQTALQFAARNDVDAHGWAVTIGTQKDDEMTEVLSRIRPPALQLVAASSTITVRFRKPHADDWFRVVLTPTGRVIGFSLSQSSGTPGTIADTAAEQVATAFLNEFLAPSSPFTLSAPKMRTVNQAKQDRMFEWQSAVPELPEAKAIFRVELAGDHVINGNCEVRVGKLLNRLHPHLSVYYWLLGLSGVYIGGMGIYAFVRYLRRAFQKEVSHRRTLLVAGLCVAMSAFTIYGNAAQATLSVNGAPPNPLQKIVLLCIFVVSFSVMGAFFGVAYGAGEGDVRAVYPGKLTSLDALLSGRIFSVNVARSILAGGAFAGLMLLVQTLALAIVHAPRPVDDNDLVASFIAVFPLGMAFSATAMHAIAVAAIGLLVPIALLRPRVPKDWLFYTLLPLCPTISAFMSQDSGTWRNFIIAVLTSVAVTCVPFFFGDFLASISGVIAFDLVGKMIFRSATVDLWAELSLPVVGVGLVFLLAEVWFAERGRRYEEWEVRPQYARYVAERLSLQAEIGAARQAQLRLLPDVPPQIAGLSIAGSCVPAREVGGDFYDYFALDDHRLGVFIAEGGNRELASAMPIALAKGYLVYAVRLDLNPVEILRRLRDVLASTLHEAGASISMIYAVIDAPAATIRYARTGSSPVLTINGNRAVEEVAASRGSEPAIHHGAATLAPRDAVVFYTDGLAAQIAERKREPIARFLAQTAVKMRESSAAGLHSAILQAAIRRATDPPPDDVTAVVIRLEEPVEHALEVVV